jgi:hyperosmotically inducible periplasmic protein
MNMSNKSKYLLPALFAGALLMSGCASTSTQESTGEYVDDTWITTKVKAKFVEDKTVSAMAVNVETFKGTVQLSGFANSAAEADRAVQLARETKGVKSVKNDIRIK